MQNVGLGYYNLANIATITDVGSSWLAGAPASNVGLRDRSKTARSTTASGGSKTMRFALGGTYPVRLIALVGHNLSSAGQLKLNCGTSAGGTTLHSGTLVNAWQITPFAYDGRAFSAWYTLAAAVSCSYVDLVVTDTGNTDGYIDIPRVYLGDIWQPTINAEYGLKRVPTPNDKKVRLRGGSTVPDAQLPSRSVQFAMMGLTAAEADQMYLIQHHLGTAQEVLYVEDPTDAARTQLYGCLGTLDEVSGVELPDCGQYTTGIKHTEG